ncbi:excalibur calcium-binding domain-containing protein [Lysobacter psychrotolerans]|uniref:Excalibur calcium-binding domain-containing protein n=1 Tax=Montanilutibacter psychrotolerans TaxID=1327343 RepID=A0A3M8STI8_9GAMM|nr:hypothetical protein EER27_12845 [Lysobacter psychrotolerans]
MASAPFSWFRPSPLCCRPLSYAAPLRRGDPGHGRHLDRDGDGIGCE